MWNLNTLHKPQPLVFNEYNPTHRFFLELYKEVGGYVWDVLVQESLEEVLDGSLDQVSQPALKIENLIVHTTAQNGSYFSIELLFIGLLSFPLVLSAINTV